MKIYGLPPLLIETQLFHTPGAGYDGGLTAGGAQFITPEPGGFGILEISPPVWDSEWDNPLGSWLMSKISGQVLRARLKASPQIAYSAKRGRMLDQEWTGDVAVEFTAVALKGAVEVKFDMTGFGPIVLPGHVIGHAFDTYLIDEISYAGDIATATVTPPLRRGVAVNDECHLRPWFTGRISNGADIRSAYNHLGHVKIGNIILQEAIV